MAPIAVVARTQILCKEGGVVCGVQKSAEAVRRCLVLRNSDVLNLTATGAPIVNKGDLVVEGSLIAPGVFAPESGQVISVSKGTDNGGANSEAALATSGSTIKIRIGRPPKR